MRGLIFLIATLVNPLLYGQSLTKTDIPLLIEDKSIKSARALIFDDRIYISWIQSKDTVPGFYVVEKTTDSVLYTPVYSTKAIIGNTNFDIMYSFIDSTSLADKKSIYLFRINKIIIEGEAFSNRFIAPLIIYRKED
jgi:hypothetical protein